MQKLITIKKDESILVSSQVESFLKPDYVYLPLLNEDHILVRLKDKIKIGDALEQASSYLAPVSGVVRGLKKMTSLKNRIPSCSIRSNGLYPTPRKTLWNPFF